MTGGERCSAPSMIELDLIGESRALQRLIRGRFESADQLHELRHTSAAVLASD
jgi:hypothetical protein